MPIKENSECFELKPYSIFYTSLISGVLIIIGVAIILGGFYEKNRGQIGYTYFFVIGGLFVIGGIGFLIYRIWKSYSGSLSTITFDIEGIREYKRKNGLQQSVTWDEKPRLLVKDDDDDDPESISISTNNKDKTISFTISDYTTITLTSYKLIEKTKAAIASFKEKYRNSQK